MPLFLVRMKVDWPKGMDPEEDAALRAAEKAYGAKHQREGTWLHLWRTPGVFGNVSVFDVPDHERLHEVLSELPFFPFLTITVEPLAHHSSRVEPEPRAGRA